MSTNPDTAVHLPIDVRASGADVRVTDAHWQELRLRLLADDEEHAALMYCGLRQHNGRTTYLVRDIVFLNEPDYLARGRDHLSISPATFARHSKRARLAGAALILVHSHPFPGAVSASGIDLRTELDICQRVLTGRTDAPAGAMIIGPDGVDGRSWTPDGATPLHTVHVLGERITRIHATSRGLTRTNEPRSGANRRDPSGTTDRQELLWGERGQQTLRNTHVALVGVGGTGSHVATQLAHLRVGELTLIDNDRIEPSNLSRVVGATPADVGRLKVDVLAAVCKAVNPDMAVHTVPESVLDADPAVYSGADLIVCATDSHGSRSLLTEVAVQYLIPVVDLGVEVVPDNSSFRAGGGVRVLRPDAGCLWCAQTLSPALVREEYLTEEVRALEAPRGYLRDASVAEPSVVALNGVVASLAVLEVCQLVVGMLGSGKSRLLLRAEQRSVTTASITRNPGCHVCGRDGFFALGQSRALNTRRSAHTTQSG